MHLLDSLLSVTNQPLENLLIFPRRFLLVLFPHTFQTNSGGGSSPRSFWVFSVKMCATIRVRPRELRAFFFFFLIFSIILTLLQVK